jgi:hypothetical protein
MVMSLRRGFKANANRISVRLRRGQGARPEAPIDLNVLVTKLSIGVIPLSEFKAQFPQAVQQLTMRDSGAFSAATLPPNENGKRILVLNDSHDLRRQNSNIAHEIAHILLGHPFTFPIDGSGSRNIDRELEEEANWLGPTILVSDEAALHIVQSELPTDTACMHYKVTEPVLRMRINASGAMIRKKRSSH